jgi:hypothetical protein
MNGKSDLEGDCDESKGHEILMAFSAITLTPYQNLETMVDPPKLCSFYQLQIEPAKD